MMLLLNEEELGDLLQSTFMDEHCFHETWNCKDKYYVPGTPSKGLIEGREEA